MRQVIMLWSEANPSTIEKNHLMSSGLVQNGMDVSVIMLCHKEEEHNLYTSIVGTRPPYHFDMGPVGALFRGNNRLTKLINNCKLAGLLFLKLFKTLYRHSDSTLIIPRETLEIAIPAIILSKIFRCRLIANIMEYAPSLPLYHKHIRNRIRWNLILTYSDAYIVISKFLMEIFQDRGKPIFYLPAIIDGTSLNEIKKLNDSSYAVELATIIEKDIPILLYTCDSVYGEILEFCLQALAMIKESKFVFYITGRYTDSEQNEWLEMIERLGLSNRIVFTGFIDQEDLLNLQIKSTALLIPLPNTIRHKARFPQKILKYICLKKPIISTNIGEIASLFEDNQTAFIDKSISIDGYAQKIKYTLSNPDMVHQVCENAYELVLTRFNHLLWGMRLKEFITRVRK